MGRITLGAALLMLAAPSYAWTASPEAMLGAPPAAPAEAVAAAQSWPAKALPRDGELRRAGRYAGAVARLQAERAAATRGSNEVRVYQQASPAVVLIVSENGVGSGALIDAQGRIVTNLHVVGDDEEVGVVFKPKVEGQKIGETDVVVAKVIRRDAVTDLALVQVANPPAGVAPLELGDSATVEIGADVHAIGHPTGGAWTYTRGIISQVRRDYVWTFSDDKVQHKATVIQTQTPINPGNSGGPLLDDQMRIVGVNSFSGEGEGINFAVSADEVRALLERKSDRVAAPGTKAPGGKNGCEVATLKRWRSIDPSGTNALLDVDCDGEGDMTAHAPDDDREPILFMLDTNEDGDTDAIMVDKDRDLQFEVGLFDTDGDGKSDMRGYFRNNGEEPYRYERIKE